MIISSGLDIYNRYQDGKRVVNIQGILADGIRTPYLSEQGKKIKSALRFLKAMADIATMDTMDTMGVGMNIAEVGHFKKLSRMWLGYAKLAAASNGTYDASVVFRDLNQMQNADKYMDKQAGVIVQSAFNSTQGFASMAFALDIIKMVVDCGLLIGGPVMLIKHYTQWKMVLLATRNLNEFTYNFEQELVPNGNVNKKASLTITLERMETEWSEFQRKLKNRGETGTGPLPSLSKEVGDVAKGVSSEINFDTKFVEETKNGKIVYTPRQEFIKSILDDIEQESFGIRQIKSKRIILTKPSSFFSFTKTQVITGFAMVTFTFTLEIFNYAITQAAVNVFKDYAKQLADNDNDMRDALVDTMKAWQA